MAQTHDKSKDNRDSQKYKVDVSHNMLGGQLFKQDQYVAETDDGLTVTNSDGTIAENKTVTAQMVSTTQNHMRASLGNPDDAAYRNMAGVSLDGFQSPYSTTFSKSTIKGQHKENQRTFGSDEKPIPSFEKPYTITDEKDNDISLGAWWHVGSGVVTAATLNPLAYGHNTQSVIRGQSIKEVKNDITIEKGGYEKHSPKIGEIKSDNESGGHGSRSIGLVGPVVMTGWGNDTHGFPTPNAQFDAERREHRPDSDFWGRPRDEPVQFTHGNPKIHHTPLHLKRQDQWKSGPIDLRWDRDRKVWTGGRHNGIYLCKATRCILPQAGADGQNSFNFGINNNIASLGRLYRNPCANDDCKYWMYFPKSKLYPDIEIYDPEDKNWCGNCSVKKDDNGNLYVDCDEMVKACVPFYDAIIMRSTDHITGGENSKVNCGDKFYKTGGGNPYSRRMGDPCHGWGDSKVYATTGEKLVDKVLGTGNRGAAAAAEAEPVGAEPVGAEPAPSSKNAPPTFSETALPLLYKKILLENPLNQGLMLGDNFLSYDTGRSIVVEYTKSRQDTVCTQNGDPITVKEVIPIHIILQAEFYGMEIISHAGCEQGEMSACTRKFFAQGFVTGEDCGPDDDYPLTAIR